MNGEGERTTAAGEIYRGIWMDGQLNGFGQIITSLGAFNGEVIDSVENGHGTMVKKNYKCK